VSDVYFFSSKNSLTSVV